MLILLNGLFVYDKKDSLRIETVFLVFLFLRAIVSCLSMHSFCHHYNDIQTKWNKIDSTLYPYSNWNILPILCYSLKSLRNITLCIEIHKFWCVHFRYEYFDHPINDNLVESHTSIIFNSDNPNFMSCLSIPNLNKYNTEENELKNGTY